MDYEIICVPRSPDRLHYHYLEKKMLEKIKTKIYYRHSVKYNLVQIFEVELFLNSGIQIYLSLKYEISKNRGVPAS